MTEDRELVSFRQGYYQMLVSLFWSEPSGELLKQLSNGITERIQAAQNLHRLLAAGWEETDRFLTETPSESLSEAVIDEYTRLFIGPLGPEVNPYESFYLTGRLLDRPLANVRTFLKTVGIEKREEYAEPEDSLAFELEVMHWLICKQTAATSPEDEARWLRFQADFLREHLLIWAPTCAQDIEKAESAKFYRCAAMILRGFLEVERTLFPNLGVEKVTSLEEVRRRYGSVPTWRGPTIDVEGDEPGVPSSEKKD